VLHPFMPFLTEELWQRSVDGKAPRSHLLALTRWPTAAVGDPAAAAEINWLVELISEVRSVRSEMNVPAGAQIPLVIAGASELTRHRVQTHRALIERLARVESISLAEAAPRGAAQIVVGDAIACLPLAGIIDLAAEKNRLVKE